MMERAELPVQRKRTLYGLGIEASSGGYCVGRRARRLKPNTDVLSFRRRTAGNLVRSQLRLLSKHVVYTELFGVADSSAAFGFGMTRTIESRAIPRVFQQTVKPSLSKQFSFSSRKSRP